MDSLIWKPGNLAFKLSFKPIIAETTVRIVKDSGPILFLSLCVLTYSCMLYSTTSMKVCKFESCTHLTRWFPYINLSRGWTKTVELHLNIATTVNFGEINRLGGCLLEYVMLHEVVAARFILMYDFRPISVAEIDYYGALTNTKSRN